MEEYLPKQKKSAESPISGNIGNIRVIVAHEARSSKKSNTNALVLKGTMKYGHKYFSHLYEVY